jgi:hypothetical protein
MTVNRDTAASSDFGPRFVVLVPKAIATSFILAFFLLYFLAGQPFGNPYPGGDFLAYWHAAERLRDGAALYPPGADAGLAFVYRYAPWFAFAFIPLTYFPVSTVLLLWQLGMLGAGFYLLRPLMRPLSLASLLLLLLCAPLVIDLAWVGNVEALMILLIGVLLPRPLAGPIAVGLAASLKITPILFAAHYVAKRQWSQALLAIGVTVGLWLPAIALGLSDYPTAPLPTIAVWGVSPVAGELLAVVVVLVTAWLALSRSRWTLTAAAAATLATSPVLFITSLPRMLVPVWSDRREDRE